MSAIPQRDELVDGAVRAICYGSIEHVTFFELPSRHTRVELERGYRRACQDRAMLREEMVRLRAELEQTLGQMRTLSVIALRIARDRDRLRIPRSARK
jgi:hypothetical protein